MRTIYRILLVDDEPIIVTGLKFMIPWEDYDCTIVGTAANGQIALEKSRQLQPDIIFADINMPVLSGMDLLRELELVNPSIVFIMLTNLQDFTLIQESLRLHAADYLVKTQLNPETLVSSLERAIGEVDRRRPPQQRSALLQESKWEERQALAKSAITGILLGSDPSREILKHLETQKVLTGYRVMRLDYLCPQGELSDQETLLPWFLESAEKLAESTFPNYVLPVYQDHIYLFSWGNEQDNTEESMEVFQKRLITVTDNIIGKQAVLLYTQVYSGAEQLADCFRELELLEVQFYLSGECQINYRQILHVTLEPLPLQSTVGKLSAILEHRSRLESTAFFHELCRVIDGTPHRKKDVLWICRDLYLITARALGQSEVSLYGLEYEQVLGQIKLLQTKRDVLQYLGLLEELVQCYFADCQGPPPIPWSRQGTM